MLYIRDFVLKVVVLFPFVALLVFGAVTPPDLNKHWQSHKVKYGKSYTSPQDEISRRLIFEDNFKKIEKHNTEYRLGRHSYFLGVNKFADNTHEEFLRILKKFHLNTTKEFTFLEPSHIVNLPRYVDWRKKGAVTPVKDQRDCGSCWAYSATGALEAQHFKRTGKLVALSEQNLVDCSRNWGNHGCYGGFMHLAFQYVKDNGGIDTENSYPYEAEEQECSFTKANIGAISRGYTNIPTGNETVLAYAVATVGPIAVAIDSSYESLKLYKGGIYDEPNCSTTDLSHAVLVVGYGTKNGKDYWIVKNSWGAEWGEKGYILMSRNKNNQCGIATLATYPLI